jgi:DNA gyrase subunit A
VMKTIAYLEDLLAHPQKILALIKDDLLDLKEHFGDPRRTHIAIETEEELEEEDLIPEEQVLISITQRGYIKRTPVRAYRAGRGVTGMTTREEDAVLYLFAASTLDSVLFFTNAGKVYQEKVYQIPDADRKAKGVTLASLLALGTGERVTAALPVSDFEQAEYLTMATRRGRIKRTALGEFASVRPSGLIAINLDGDDELGWVRLTTGDQEVIIVTERGRALRFGEDKVRPQGRVAAGVWAIKLGDGDLVSSMDVIEPGGELLIVTSQGWGKRTPLSDYPTKGRHTGGVITLPNKYLAKTGLIGAARVVQPGDEVTLISAEGAALRLPVKSFPLMGRATRGQKVKALKLRTGDSVASVARLSTP